MRKVITWKPGSAEAGWPPRADLVRNLFSNSKDTLIFCHFARKHTFSHSKSVFNSDRWWTRGCSPAGHDQYRSSGLSRNLQSNQIVRNICMKMGNAIRISPPKVSVMIISIQLQWRYSITKRGNKIKFLDQGYRSGKKSNLMLCLCVLEEQSLFLKK